MDADGQVSRDLATEDYLEEQMENPIIGYENAKEAVFSGIKVTWEDEDSDLDLLCLW